MCLKHVEIGITQKLYPQNGCGLLAGFTTIVVLRAYQLMLHIRVYDHDDQAFGDPDLSELKALAVDAQGMIGSTAGRDGLIHDPAFHSYIGLSRLSHQRNFLQGNIKTEGTGEQMTEGHLQGGGGGKSGSQGDVA